MERKFTYLKKALICVMLLAVFFPSCDGGRDKDQKMIILTGPGEGIYYTFMEDLFARLKAVQGKPLDKDKNKLDIYTIYSTPGSIFNLERLSRGQANFAITQPDVLSGPVGRKGYETQAAAPLFREYIFIFRLRPEPGKPRAAEFDLAKVQRINIPGKGSGTHLTAKRFMELAGLDPGKAGTDPMSIVVTRGVREALMDIVGEARAGKFNYFLFAVLDLDDPLIRDISDGRLDGWDRASDRDKPARVWQINGKDNRMRNIYESPGYAVEFVSLPTRVTESMQDLYGIYENTSISFEDSEGSLIGPISTLFMRTFLVVRSDEKQENVEAFLDYFSGDGKFLETIAGSERTRAARVEKPNHQVKWPIPIHVGAYNTLSRHAVIKDTRRWKTWVLLIGYFSLVLIFIILVVILAVQRKIPVKTQLGKSMMLKKRLGSVSDRRNFFGLLCLVFLLLICACSFLFINIIEESASRTYGYESPFKNMSIPGVALWLFIFIISGTEQGIFPSTPYSMYILLSLNIVLKVVTPATIGIYVYQWLAELMQRKSGAPKKSSSGHVVFIGWNKICGSLVKKVVEIDAKFKFVIITPDNTNPLEEPGLPSRNVGLVQGSPLDAETLKKACIDRAQRVYLVPPHEGKENYLTGLPVYFEKFLEKLLNGKKLEQIPPIFILIFDPKTRGKPVYKSLKFKKTTPLERPPAYDKLVRSLFFGSGIYPLFSHWVKSRFQKKKKSADKKLALSEVILDRKKLASVEKKWKIDRQKRRKGDSPFAKLMDARNAKEFITAYNQADRTLKKQDSTLVGISLKYQLKQGVKQDNESGSGWVYFSAPVPDEDKEKNGGVFKFEEIEKIEKAVLYFMNYGGKRK